MRKLALVLVFGAAACSGTRVYAPESASATPAPKGPDDYVLSPSDKVRVTVFNEPTLSGEFVVNPAGKVSLPLVGEIKAEGQTAAQLNSAIEQALAAGYLREPKVATEILTYRPFYVLGEVNHAGEFPYTDRMTVLQAIASAQGFTFRADKHRVFLKRAGQEGEHQVPLTSDLTIAPGDTIRVGERYF